MQPSPTGRAPEPPQRSMSSLAVAPRAIATARANASNARAPTRSNARVVARARAPIGASPRGLGQAHRARGRIVVDAAADAAADDADDKPRFVPAHERTTLSKILPEQLLAGGVLLKDAPEEWRQSFTGFLGFEFMTLRTRDMPGLRVLNIDPPVFTVDDFLSASECDALTTAAEASGGLAVSAIGGAQNENIRTSRTVALNSHGLENHPSKNAILSRAEYLLPAVEGLSKGADAFRAPKAGEEKWSFELPQVAHYSGGEYFKAHEDAFPMAIAAEKGYQRRATVLVYLNDVEKGGATRFEHLDIDVQPKKGKALVFFPSSAACMPDARTLHTATEAEAGHEKWVSQLWIASSTPPVPTPEELEEQNKKKAAAAEYAKLPRKQRRAMEKEAAKAAKKAGKGGQKGTQAAQAATPVIEKQPEVASTPEPEPVARPEAQPEPVAEPEPVAQAEPEPEPVAELVAEPEPEPIVEPTPVEPEPEPEQEDETAAKADNRGFVTFTF